MVNDKIKRPTCYVALDNLFKSGYVTKIERKATSLYSAEDPKIILNKYQEKVANFKDFLPYFDTRFTNSAKPRIRYYEGAEELYNVYTKILFPAEEIYFFGTNVAKIKEKLPKLFNYKDIGFIHKNKRPLEIISPNDAGMEYIKLYSPHRPIKIMPKDLPAFADSVITENKLFIVSLDSLFGVLIESEGLAKTYKNFFLLAWRAALEPPDIKTD